jgi:TctA family transporter
MKLKLILTTAIAGMAVALLAAVTPAQANQLPTGAKRRLEKRRISQSYAMARARIELATPRFSVVCSTN